MRAASAATRLRVDGLRPKRVERPESAEDLAEVLRGAAAAEEGVVPVGGGRALGLGDPLQRFDVGLETQGLGRVLEYSPTDMTVSAEAGVTLEELNSVLAGARQVLPIDPFAAPGHTLGGVLAAALAGPLRLRFGTPRDFLLGLRVALPDGRLAVGGGRVVKNVSGYDMPKLHLGALGALGIIVAATLKVFPLPQADLTLATTPDDEAGGAWAEAARALALRLAPAALELDSSGRLLARFWGPTPAVAGARAELGWEEADPAVWAEHSQRGGVAWARISVPPARLRGVIESLQAGGAWWASPGVGVAYWTGFTAADAVRSARAAAEATGGNLVLLAAPPELKREVGAWGSPPPTLEWMRRLRDAFDPGRTISPGRYIV
ncbi:MAG: FAD-binding oxidoreductase [Candidatus Dormibacteraeota bacterium]|nr:FAD-binding oxidoreductase [Candidatus Dormibacteraeota bacterium]